MKSKIWGNLFLFFFSILFICIFAEIFVRLIVDHGMEYNLEMWKYAKVCKRVSPDRRLGHEHIPMSHGHFMGRDVSINSDGLRDREFPKEKKLDVTRIMMLGDSITFGWGVAQDKTVSKLLGKFLNENSKQAYEVINTGVGNYNTDMEIGYFLKRGYAFHSDIVILNYFINDAEETPHYHGNFLSEHSYAYVYFGGVLDSFYRIFLGKVNYQSYYRNLYLENQKGWEQAKQAIRELVEFCNQNKIQLVIINYPELRKLKDYPFMDITEKIKKLAQEQNVPFDDLYHCIRHQPEKPLWVTPQDSHPSEFACEIFAKEIKEFLIQQNLTAVH